jgi:hypothetical protein
MEVSPMAKKSGDAKKKTGKKKGDTKKKKK